MAAQHFANLVEMQETSCKSFSTNNLFGVRGADGWGWTTYGEFGTRVDEFRSGLASLGVTSGDRVAVICDNSVNWAVGAYAVYGLGGQYVPMYEAQLPKNWHFILNDCGAKAVLVANAEIAATINGMRDKLDALEQVINIGAGATGDDSMDAVCAAGRANPVPSVSPAADDLAGLIYTSGTTGNPKGVMLSHGNITSNVNAVHEVFPMDRSDTSLSFLPWAHSFGQTCELHCLLSMGASIALAESVDKLVDNLGEVKPTLLFSVPRIFNRIYDSLQKRMAEESAITRTMFNRGIAVAEKRREMEEAGRSSWFVNLSYGFYDKLVFSKVRDRFGGQLKYAFSGGAALSPEVAEFIDNMGILVFEGYGLTETSPIATANYPGHRRIGTIGKPLPGIRVVACDQEGTVLPAGVEGELVVMGPNVMQGYYNLPEKTDEVIFDLKGERAFRTGDLGQIGEDGFVRITGRVKEKYKLENGKYVVPSPLEEQLQLSGFIGQLCIYGHNRPFNIAIVVPDFEAVRKWADEEGLSYNNDEELCANEKIVALIQGEIEKYGADFKRFELPRKITLAPEEFSIENDMITPSLKLKRRNVIKRFEDAIEKLYAR